MLAKLLQENPDFKKLSLVELAKKMSVHWKNESDPVWSEYEKSQHQKGSPPSPLTFFFVFKTAFAVRNGVLNTERQCSAFAVQNAVLNRTLRGRTLNGVQRSSSANSRTERGVHVQRSPNHVSSVQN